MMLLALLMLFASRRLSDMSLETAPYWAVHAWGALILVLGPLIYFYVRTSVDASYLFKGTRLLHFIPALLHLSLLVPLLLVDLELRAAYVETYLERELYRSLIPGVRLGFILTTFYALLSFWWVRRFEKHVLDTASFGDEQHVRWLKWFTGLIVLLLFLLGLFSLREPYQLLAAGAMTSFVSTLTFIALVRPQVFHGIATALKLPDEAKDAEKYRASHLDEAQKTLYLDTLLQFFEQEKPYLQQELTLREVAKQVNIPDRYVSQVVNEKLDKHFMDFVNGYRIEATQTMLLDPAWTHLSIDGIAAEAGFKSRSAFYTAFKKATGTTPAAFRKTHQPI